MQVHLKASLCLSLLCAPCLAWTQAINGTDNAADESALRLADQTPIATQSPSNWRVFVEAAHGRATQRVDDASVDHSRLSLDIQYEAAIAPGWRAVLADRLDLDWPAKIRHQNSINTIKEAYLSWQPDDSTIVDFGRVNPHYGVATGYNPTDYFRANALRSIVSADPASLKENRQGSVMVRAQTLWDGGSISTIVSPKLSARSNTSAFNPDVGATNHEHRVLVVVSQKITEDLTPQILVYKAQGSDTQLGANLTSLLNDSTVLFAEWSGGRNPTLLSQALAAHGLPYTRDIAFRNHLAVGGTYTTANKMSLTAQYEYNGSGLDELEWTALRNGSPTTYGVYRNFLQSSQQPPTKRAVFLYARWQDALVNHLDLSAMARYNNADFSRYFWLEARYHMNKFDFALQWQRTGGKMGTEYGASPQVQSWQLAVRRYF